MPIAFGTLHDNGHAIHDLCFSYLKTACLSPHGFYLNTSKNPEGLCPEHLPSVSPKALLIRDVSFFSRFDNGPVIQGHDGT